MSYWQQLLALNAGEFSRRLESRSDLPKYFAGARKMENFIALPYGGISNRPGTEYIAASKSGATYTARLMPFRFSTATNFQLEFGHQYVRFYASGAAVTISTASAWADTTAYALGDQVAHGGTNYVCIAAHTSDDGATPGVDDGAGDNEPGIGTDSTTYWYALTGSILELPTPYQSTELFEIQFLQIKNVVYLVHPNHQPRRMLRLSDSEWTIEALSFDYPALLDPNPEASYLMAVSDATVGTGRTLTASGTGHAPFTANHVGSYFEIAHRRASALVRIEIDGTKSSDPLWVHGVVTVKTPEVSGAAWDGTLRVQQQNAAGTWETIRSYDSKKDRNIQETFTVEEPSFLRLDYTEVAAETGDPYAILEAADTLQRGLVLVTGYTSSTQVTVTVINPLNSTGTTRFFSEGAFSAAQGWPRAIAFHEGRVWYGGTASEPLRVWGTQTDNYETFRTGIADTDGVDFTLSSPRNNQIQWMISQRGSLVIGTSGGEFVMSSRSNESGITPTNVHVEQQSNFGSDYIQALLVNDSLVFAQRLGRKIRDYFYNWERDQREAMDLTLLAEHITLGGIVQMDFSQLPIPVLWCVTGSGELIGLTYERTQDVIAWHRHTTDGTFESVSVIPGDDADEVWTVVKRTINGATVRYIERLEPETMSSHLVTIAEADAESDAENYLFADAGKKVTQSSSTTVSGLSHLEGEEVAVLVNGATHPRKTVSSGAITLDWAGTQISVGLPYTPKLETLPMVAPTRSGSSKGQTARIHRAVVEFFRSRACTYTSHGASAADSKWSVIPFRDTIDAMDSPPPLFTGEKDVTLQGKFDTKCTVALRVDSAQPCTVLALTLKADVSQSN